MQKINDDLTVYNGSEAIPAMRARLGDSIVDVFEMFDKDLREQFKDAQIITETYIDKDDQSKNIAMFLNLGGRITFARISEDTDGNITLKNEI